MSEENVKVEEIKEKDTAFVMDGKPEDIAQLALKISKVMSGVKPIEKAGYNKSDDYDYLQAEDLIEEVRPLLAKERVALLSSVDKVHIKDKDDYNKGAGNKVLMHMVFKLLCADTGASIDFKYSGYALDYGDKFLYKAYTNAIKYALKNNFMLSAGKMIDVEDDEFEQATSEKPKKKQKTKADKKDVQKMVKKQKEEIAAKARAKRKKAEDKEPASADKVSEMKRTQKLFAKNNKVVKQVITEEIEDANNMEVLTELDASRIKEINETIEKLIAEQEEAAS